MNGGTPTAVSTAGFIFDRLPDSQAVKPSNLMARQQGKARRSFDPKQQFHFPLSTSIQLVNQAFA